MTILYMIIAFICLVIPWILTVINIVNIFKKKKIKENIVDILTFVLGILLTAVLYFISGFKDYAESLRLGGLEIDVHAPIASWSMPTVVTILLLGVVSYYLIRRKKLNLPPLVIVCSMSGILICSIYMILFMIQISNEGLWRNWISGLPYFYLFPVNYILCSIRAILEMLQRYKEKELPIKEYDNKLLERCRKILYDIDTWPIIAILLTIPLTMVLIGILVLFGQRPDEAIKAFLETSDWTLSGKISPPSVTYDGHYLCTVALKGHESLVKPTRMGYRRGEKIVVNRQLCIANAFEDFIQEKTPRFHHVIRYIYDKYGFPLSKHINNAWQADITYLFMKPLEWVFLIFLYLFDKKPENRIAIQYTVK